MASSKKNHKKIIIIGAGSAGLAAQKIIHQHTQDYLLVDRGPWGTTCARVGCMPSKTLIEAAKIFNNSEKQKKIGLKPQKLNAPGAIKKIFEHTQKLTQHFVDGVLKDLKKIPSANIIEAEAAFIDKHTLRVGDQIYTADHFIVATGSSPSIPPLFQEYKKDLLLSDDIFKLKSLPKSISVVGAGSIGLELACALSDLGARVTVFGAQRGLGPLTDPQITKEAQTLFAKKFKIIFEDVVGIQKQKTSFKLKTKKSSQAADKILLASGRKPNLQILEGFQLAQRPEGGIKHHALSGKIDRTNIYLAGDVKNQRPLLHEAVFEGTLIGLLTTQQSKKRPRAYVPLSITFTSPQMAVVGKSYRSLTEEKEKFETYESSFANQGRSRTRAENEGLIKLYVHPQKRTLLGAELLGHQAEHLAHFLALAMTHKLTIAKILECPFYHPVVEEGLRTALKRALSTKARSHTRAQNK